jgi:flavin reductase (DIM6/NTAB) family NADH-FMN oxidoreductase RutF
MRFDPQILSTPELYRFMISAVVPRPIAFVSTRAADGSTNLAPFSYFIALSSAPPLVGIAISEREGDPKDTLRNIRETGEWVINVVSEPLLAAMVRTAGEWPRGTSEFDVAGLTPVPAERVRAPRVLESPLHLECRLHREIPLGNSVFVVGEVLLAEAADAVVVDGRVDAARLAPVGRLGGEFYAPLREVLKVPRPRVSRATGEPLG